MATVKSLFAAMTAMACSIASLASGSAWQSSATDNSTNQFLDVQLSLLIVVAAGTPAGSKVINIYAYCSVDGSNFDDPASASDAAITLGAPNNLVLVASINVLTAGKTYSRQIPSLATKLGGVLPLKWGLVVENQTGAVLTSATLQYRGLYAQSV